MMRPARVLLVLCVLSLLWLTLFKLSYDLPGVVLEYRTRSLNLIPFAGLERPGWSEAAANLVTFVPLGLVLGMNFPATAPWRLATAVAAGSAAVETVQYVLAIGAADATDVVMNTLGALGGLLLYRLTTLGLRAETANRIILAAGFTVFAGFLLLRVLVLRVQY